MSVLAFDCELRNTRKLAFSHLSVIPLKKGIQTRIGLIWIPACAGMTERRENDDLRVSRNSKFSMSSFFLSTRLKFFRIFSD